MNRKRSYLCNINNFTNDASKVKKNKEEKLKFKKLKTEASKIFKDYKKYIYDLDNPYKVLEDLKTNHPIEYKVFKLMITKLVIHPNIVTVKQVVNWSVSADIACFKRCHEAMKFLQNSGMIYIREVSKYNWVIFPVIKGGLFGTLHRNMNISLSGLNAYMETGDYELKTYIKTLENNVYNKVKNIIYEQVKTSATANPEDVKDYIDKHIFAKSGGNLKLLFQNIFNVIYKKNFFTSTCNTSNLQRWADAGVESEPKMVNFDPPKSVISTCNTSNLQRWADADFKDVNFKGNYGQNMPKIEGFSDSTFVISCCKSILLQLWADAGNKIFQKISKNLGFFYLLYNMIELKNRSNFSKINTYINKVFSDEINDVYLSDNDVLESFILKVQKISSWFFYGVFFPKYLDKFLHNRNNNTVLYCTSSGMVSDFSLDCEKDENLLSFLGISFLCDNGKSIIVDYDDTTLVDHCLDEYYIEVVNSLNESYYTSSKTTLSHKRKKFQKRKVFNTESNLIPGLEDLYLRMFRNVNFSFTVLNELIPSLKKYKMNTQTLRHLGYRFLFQEPDPYETYKQINCLLQELKTLSVKIPTFQIKDLFQPDFEISVKDTLQKLLNHAREYNSVKSLQNHP